MHFDINRFVSTVWTLTGLYWLILAFTSKRTARRESWRSRGLHIALMALAFSFLAGQGTSNGLLNRRFLPDEEWVTYAGAFLTTLGCGLAIWARSYLGTNWSAIVSVRENHELIRSGPYALMRHPIYSGLLLAALGTAVFHGEVGGVVGFCLLFVGWYAKACLEEQAMVQQFGSEYLKYSGEVKRFIPFVL